MGERLEISSKPSAVLSRTGDLSRGTRNLLVWFRGFDPRKSVYMHD